MFTSLACLALTRRRLVLWLTGAAVVVMAVLAAGAFAQLKGGGFDDPSSDSSRAKALIDRDFGGETNLVLLVTARAGATVDAPQVAAAAGRIAGRVERDTHARVMATYWQGRDGALRSTDGRSGLITVHVDGNDTDSATYAESLIDGTTGTDGPVRVRAGGELGVGNDVTAQVGASLGIAEAVAVPITLILLVLAFGSLLAASLPLAVGLVAVAGTFAELAVLGRITDVSIYAVNLTTALGLGLAIDYSLLIVNRFREELRAGRSVDDALTTTLRTAGRTVVFSSATVAAALAAMLIFPLYFLRSFAYAGIGVTVIAMVAALVVLPALLATFGTKVAKGRRGRAGQDATESPFWRRVAAGVARRPVAVAVPLVAVLLVLGAPFLHISFSTPDDRVLRDSTQSRQVGDALRSDFTGNAASSMYAVVQGASSDAELDRYRTSVAGLAGVQSVDVAGTRDGATLLRVAGPADLTGSTAQGLVGRIRAIPAPAGSEVLLGGQTPALVDSKQAIADGLPWAVLWIALTTLVLLFLFTGSLLLPIKALVLNALSLSAVFGAVVWVFQDGHLAALLDVTPTPINTSMPVLLFCVAFGLSMDYEVFLLSRIKELHDDGAGTTEAVTGGLARTGRIVSTAAALLAVTFFAFGAGTVSFIQLFGLGTGAAIVLDATVVRGLLVPAFMQLAGAWNWWAPAPLRRLHDRVGLREAVPV